MKKSEEQHKSAIHDTCEHSRQEDSGFFYDEQDKQYCEFCDEWFTWSAGPYHYKCWIR
mgnify:FL=1|tara:strand:+ start:212 stop:385 length:174 start_codon:yes stop_codon:yes gene_type:complete